MKITIVAAIGENNVIGCDGQLPWRLKSDLKYFRALTMGKPVIMGRKTYESIGKPLEGRTNILMTHKFGSKCPAARWQPVWMRRSPLRARIAGSAASIRSW
jgi:dihydrofolate reductase